MPSPFPGMDPYLEHPDRWPDVHTRTIVELGNVLAGRLAPRYFVAVEQRTYFALPDELVFVGMPDVGVVASDSDLPRARGSAAARIAEPQVVTLSVPEEVHERYLEIREAGTGEVVTVIELISPANKRPGEGRKAYLSKRTHILMSLTSLVEIDLQRAGTPLPFEPPGRAGSYRILISRWRRRPKADLLSFGVRDPIPVFPLPLRPREPEVEVDLKSVLDTVYDRARYDLRIDYRVPPVPALEEADEAWASAFRSSAPAPGR